MCVCVCVCERERERERERARGACRREIKRRQELEGGRTGEFERL